MLDKRSLQQNQNLVCHDTRPLKNKYLFIWLCQGLVAACGIWFPHQGLNLGPLHWRHRFLAAGAPGKSLHPPFLKHMYPQFYDLLAGLVPQ